MAADKGADVYLGVGKNGAGAPYVTFVWSKSDTAAFQPIDAMSIDIDDQRVCAVDYDASSDLEGNGKEAPVYGPNAAQGNIDALKLPSFFAREAVKALLNDKLVADEKEAVPYFNCVGQVWATLLSQ
ncbi:MAG: hypothetical protein MRY63_02400 [Neomegalonema sp.]|nr:hypothetical protein [Neomegalonema sp.]